MLMQHALKSLSLQKLTLSKLLTWAKAHKKSALLALFLWAAIYHSSMSKVEDQY